MGQSAAEFNRAVAERFANNFPRLVRELSRDYEQRIGAALDLRGHPGIRSAHCTVLASLGTGAVRVTQLAEQSRVTQQAMGKTLRELERMGYLSRDVDAVDKRAREIRLTPLGQQLAADCQAAVDEVQAGYRDRVGNDDMTELEDCLRRVVQRLGLDSHSPHPPVERALDTLAPVAEDRPRPAG